MADPPDTDPKRFTAVVLAADRGPGNPVAVAAGVGCKSLAPVGGVPMVIRVLDALQAADTVADRILCGPPRSVLQGSPELRLRIAEGSVRWLENRSTPSTSAYSALEKLPGKTPVLLTTGDHALLTPEMVDHFCLEARRSGKDVVAAVALLDTVVRAYPETHRTAYRLRDNRFCSCNLFAFLTPRSRVAAQFWRQVEARRKHPLKVVGAFGWVAVVRYATGRMSLAEALDRVSRRLGFSAGVVVMPQPEAAIDVDSVADWRFAERIAVMKTG